MTVSVAWVGNGRQFTANIGTDTVTTIKYAGSGGTPSAAAADGSIEGSTALTVQVTKTGVAMFVAVPSALDFSVSGTEEDEYIYVWGNFLASSLLLTQAADGFGIALSSGTPTVSNYSLFTFFGSDNYSGGWKRMILDPTKTRSAGSGTLTLSNITHIGVFANVGGATARFDNLLLDATDVGTGLQVTGTSTLGLVEELLADEATNRYGVITALNDSETAAEIAGQVILGDDVGTAATDITDENSKLFAAEPLYYNAGIVASVPLTFCGLTVVGNGTGDTDVSIGQAVGTTTGRNGIALVGNDTYDINFDRDDGAVESSDFYGTSFENLTGIINLDGNHDFNGDVMSGCSGMSVAATATIKNLTSVLSGAIDLNSGGQLIDTIVINNTAAAAVLTDDLDDLDNVDFTSDGTGYAVNLGTVPSTATMGWNCQDSGYAATDGTTGNETIRVVVTTGVLTINVAAGASTPTIHATGGGSVSVVSGLVTLTVIVKDPDGNLVTSQDANVYVYAGATGPLTPGTAIIAAATLTDINGEVSDTAAYASDQSIIGWVRKGSATPYYKQGNITGTIDSGNGLTVTVQLVSDE